MIEFARIVLLACLLLLPSSFPIKLPRSAAGEGTEMSRMLAVDFEVFGIVQGVFFRKYTQKRGKELGLRGWCMNTPDGTVTGHLEGEKAQVEEMKQWLRHTGSPSSRIDKVEFRNEKEISKPSFSNFEIRM
ncbi:PREDICTED: acylphosphatase-2-like isoform X2 [Wasmannia auropunctata]|uniref:acylphosphatase-2-like isoform X2 n=1 Tax=Wasmannia auropunctata TaxID=64793 RepID=UPI0005EF86A1|nr:PREDICTED: acylphosphatase-2-like isoform X2 [Wasmannia auropunctata]